MIVFYFMKKRSIVWEYLIYLLFRFFAACCDWCKNRFITAWLSYTLISTCSQRKWAFKTGRYRIPQTCVYFRPATVFLNRIIHIWAASVYSSSYTFPTRQCSHTKLLPECNIIFLQWWLFRHGDDRVSRTRRISVHSAWVAIFRATIKSKNSRIIFINAA